MDHPVAKRSIELVLASHLLVDQEVLDSFGHISVRSASDPKVFFMPRAMPPALVQHEDIIAIAVETGELIDPQSPRPNGERYIQYQNNCNAPPCYKTLRYDCPLYTSICYRTALAHWEIEVGDEIPTRENGVPRSTEAIMRDVNRAFEIAVRRDPANWFWVHNRWKGARAEIPRPTPESPAALDTEVVKPEEHG